MSDQIKPIVSQADDYLKRFDRSFQKKSEQLAKDQESTGNMIQRKVELLKLADDLDSKINPINDNYNHLIQKLRKEWEEATHDLEAKRGEVRDHLSSIDRNMNRMQKEAKELEGQASFRRLLELQAEGWFIYSVRSWRLSDHGGKMTIGEHDSSNYNPDGWRNAELVAKPNGIYLRTSQSKSFRKILSATDSKMKLILVKELPMAETRPYGPTDDTSSLSTEKCKKHGNRYSRQSFCPLCGKAVLFKCYALHEAKEPCWRTIKCDCNIPLTTKKLKDIEKKNLRIGYGDDKDMLISKVISNPDVEDMTDDGYFKCDCKHGYVNEKSEWPVKCPICHAASRSQPEAKVTDILEQLFEVDVENILKEVEV